MLVDFHCHTNCSDGELSPLELIQLAEQRNIEILSITDHDNVDAYKNLPKSSIKIIQGIEFSTTWNKIGIHVVGLNIDLKSECLTKAIKLQKQIRRDRAIMISKRLDKYGLHNSYDKLNKSKYIGRPDFAKLLVEEGICKDFNHAFKKLLGAGKVGDVKHTWLDFEKIIKVILESGGAPVLAHPLYYKLTNSKLKRLILDFKQQGGMAIEVINGFQNHEKTIYLNKLCQDFELQASIGSDFHRHEGWRKLGIDTNLVNNLLIFD